MKKYRPQLFFAGAVVIGLITAMLVMGWLRDADLRHVAEAAIPMVATGEVVVPQARSALATTTSPVATIGMAASATCRRSASRSHPITKMAVINPITTAPAKKSCGRYFFMIMPP